MSSPLQFPVQVRQHDVAQQRRQRPALRRAFRSWLHEPITHQTRLQEAADESEHPGVPNLSCHSCHQQVVVDPVEESRTEQFVDEQGLIRKRIRMLPRSQWAVLIPGHHEGYIDWPAFEANQQRLGTNTRPLPHQPGGALREGAALLQGLATCGHCGRKLRTHYRGQQQTPGYHCANKSVIGGRGVYCLNVGGLQIDEAVAKAFLTAVAPAGLSAAVRAAEQLQADHDGALAQWRLAVQRAQYEADKAERRYRAVDPDNRLVARGLETHWEHSLRALEQAQAELAQRQQQRPQALTNDDRRRLLGLGEDLSRVWHAASTSARDKKELLRTLLEEVSISVYREQYRALVKLRWRGGMLSEFDVILPRSRPATVRTDEDTIGLVRRLAQHHDDATIAGILNKQERTTARGLRLLGQVEVYHPAPAASDVVPGGLHRLPRIAPGSEAVARLTEPVLEDRLQDLQHRLLDQPVHHGGHTQCPDPTRGFGDVHRAHFPWQVAARQQRRLH